MAHREASPPRSQTTTQHGKVGMSPRDTSESKFCCPVLKQERFMWSQIALIRAATLLWCILFGVCYWKINSLFRLHHHLSSSSSPSCSKDSFGFPGWSCPVFVISALIQALSGLEKEGNQQLLPTLHDLYSICLCFYIFNLLCFVFKYSITHARKHTHTQDLCCIHLLCRLQSHMRWFETGGFMAIHSFTQSSIFSLLFPCRVAGRGTGADHCCIWACYLSIWRYGTSPATITPFQRLSATAAWTKNSPLLSPGYIDN